MTVGVSRSAGRQTSPPSADAVPSSPPCDKSDRGRPRATGNGHTPSAAGHAPLANGPRPAAREPRPRRVGGSFRYGRTYTVGLLIRVTGRGRSTVADTTTV